jgi:HAMP domain-containing protein
MALHAGEADLRDGDYYGPALNRCARLRAAAHGGQVLLSNVAQALAQEAPLPEVSLRDLGVYQLRDLERPERIFQALSANLPDEFPPLRWARRLSESPLLLADRDAVELESLRGALAAIENGHFPYHLPVHRSGPAREIALALNAKLDFLDELTVRIRSALLRGGAKVQQPRALGRWNQLVEAVNCLSHELAQQFGDIGRVVAALRSGDFSHRVNAKSRGELKETLNETIDRLETLAHEHARITQEVGLEGKFGGLAQVPGVAGTWKGMTDNLNMMASNLTGQVRNIGYVVSAVVRGDFTRKVTVEAKGEMGMLTEELNRLVDILNLVAGEVSRAASGDHGGPQGGDSGLPGEWREIFDHLNSIAPPSLP